MREGWENHAYGLYKQLKGYHVKEGMDIFLKSGDIS